MASSSVTRLQERRTHRRVRVLWGATLRLADDTASMTCSVANVSASGAKLTHAAWPEGEAGRVADALESGRAVQVAVGDTAELPAEVVWCARGRLGIKFHVDPETVAGHLGSVLTDG